MVNPGAISGYYYRDARCCYGFPAVRKPSQDHIRGLFLVSRPTFSVRHSADTEDLGISN